MTSGYAALADLVDLGAGGGGKFVPRGLPGRLAFVVTAKGASCRGTLELYIEKQPSHAHQEYVLPNYTYDSVTCGTYGNHIYYIDLGCHALPNLSQDQATTHQSLTAQNRVAPTNFRACCHTPPTKHHRNPITAIGLPLPRGTQFEEID